ncbi:MAG: flavin reductase family protein [Lachnospiraceae bacterium]|jgi:flavin reductase (DIM6/NTAB) family NADH-FMN oxidoreductase RutF
MRLNFGSREWVYPMPVFIIGTYDEQGRANAMNAAWGGIIGDHEICLCLSKGHKTTANILASKSFTVSIGTEDTKDACDFVGIVSANYHDDKLERAGWHTSKAQFVNAPVIEELPMTLECQLISYDEKNGHLFGKIINICIDKSVLTDGKLDVAKLKPISYDPVHSKYYTLGEQVGRAFSDGKKLR